MVHLGNWYLIIKTAIIGNYFLLFLTASSAAVLESWKLLLLLVENLWILVCIYWLCTTVITGYECHNWPWLSLLAMAVITGYDSHYCLWLSILVMSLLADIHYWLWQSMLAMTVITGYDWLILSRLANTVLTGQYWLDWQILSWLANIVLTGQYWLDWQILSLLANIVLTGQCWLAVMDFFKSCYSLFLITQITINKWFKPLKSQKWKKYQLPAVEFFD